MTILVIAAHPDDEVLGCGGTIASAAAGGEDVHIAILGEGISSRHERRDAAAAGDLQALQDDARSAAAAMGARSVTFAGLPDNRFDQVALLDVVKQVEAWIAQFQPAVIYTHHPGDLNVDHGVTFRAVLTATHSLEEIERAAANIPLVAVLDACDPTSVPAEVVVSALSRTPQHVQWIVWGVGRAYGRELAMLAELCGRAVISLREEDGVGPMVDVILSRRA